MIQRRYDFDWLRTIVIINLIPSHVVWLMVYIPKFSQVSTTSITSTLLSTYLLEITPWHMPLLFLIAGYSSAISLSRRSLREYSRERIRRLFVPLVFFMLTIGTLQSYLFLTINDAPRSFNNFFFEHLPYYFQTLFNGNRGIAPRWGHLWFIAYLLVINLITIPLFLKIGSKRIKRITTGLKSHLVWLPMVIFGSIMATLGWRWSLLINGQTLIADWGYFTYNLFAFIIGYLLFFDQSLGKKINSKLRLWLVLFLGSSITRLFLLSQYQEAFYDGSDLGRHLLCSAVTGVHTWSVIALMLALAYRYLATSNNPFLVYMKKASFPFYVLHLPITVILGIYITPLELGFLPEFLLLTILTAVITILAYELLVKPWSFVQFLMGVKINAAKS